jgi:hypothetical protein
VLAGSIPANRTDSNRDTSQIPIFYTTQLLLAEAKLGNQEPRAVLMACQLPFRVLAEAVRNCAALLATAGVTVGRAP